jgi:hypothetical protein
MTVVPEPDELWEDVTRIPARLRTAPRRKRSSGIFAAVLIVGGILSALGGLFYWQTRSVRPLDALANAPRHSLPAPQTTSPGTKTEPVQPVGEHLPPALSPSPPPSETPRPTLVAEAPPPPQAAPDESAPAAQTARPLSPTPAPKADEKPSPAAKVEDTAERRAAFDRAVNHARAALVARDLQEAALRLDAAEANVRLPAHLDEVKQLRALSEQLKLFFNAVRRGLAKYEPTEEINIGGLVAAIVDVGPDRVTLFIEGSKRNFTIASMPTAMVLFFARSGADENQPAAAAFFGAFHAADRLGDRATARALWRRAGAADVPVEDLLPLLDGPPLAARREPVPDADLVAAAAARVQGPLSDLIVSAESGPRKSLVAAKLLDAARRADNSPEQYAALQQARDWAVSAGDPATALAALDELGRWFDVDGLELKSKALGAALAGRSTSQSVLQAATVALELSAQAERDGRDELALTFSDIAYNAARQTRESELVKRAYRRRSELSDKIKSRSRSRSSQPSPAKR